jgi:hypothetical protein
MKFNFLKKNFSTKKNHHLEQRIGKRLSTYRENIIHIQTNEKI